MIDFLLALGLHKCVEGEEISNRMQQTYKAMIDGRCYMASLTHKENKDETEVV